jgi:hypothetical protein
MNLPFDEEMTPKHRIAALTFDSESEARRRLVNSKFCGICCKLSLLSEADARSYIGLLLAKPMPRRNPRPDGCTLKPYECPHGQGWHVGRDQKTAEILRERKAR